MRKILLIATMVAAPHVKWVHTEPNSSRADVDGDGVISIADVTALIDYLLN